MTYFRILLFFYFLGNFCLIHSQVSTTLIDKKNKCDEIAESLISKKSELDLLSWYEGGQDEVVNDFVFRLKEEFNKHKRENIVYHSLLLSSKEFIYVIHFVEKDDNIELGRLFVLFKDDNLLIDDVKFISREDIEYMNSKLKKEKPSIPD